MNEIRLRLKALRQEMLNRDLDAWYISGTDPHASEYLPERWQTRQFISGFTGSYGIVVVTQEEAGLWTDSRYFIQAEEQLKGSGIKMHKLRVPGFVSPETWLTRKLSPGSKVGFDAQSLSVAGYRNLENSLHDCGIIAVETPDFFEKIWNDRPALSANSVFELSLQYTGLSRKRKRDLINAELKRYKADFHIITALDELSWMFNLRGTDIPYNPVFTGYGVIGKDEWILFIDPVKVPAELKLQLEREKITLQDYESFIPWLKSVRGEKIFVDASTASFAVYNALQPENRLVEGTSLIALQKAQKNHSELEGFRLAMKKDGVALVEFLYWLHKNIGKIEITEYTAGKQLAAFRAQQEDFTGESFPVIMGYREHGAIVHLNVGKDDALKLEQEGILLFDSGGQYLQGTTDVTRTVAMGEPTVQQKTDYTLVLKGMMALSMAKFPEGTRGCNIDVLARMSLWQHGLNYGHGTGHGVGHFLNVHEGPASIRQDLNEVTLQPGMVLSNEPGLYRPGQYGIRIENLVVCVEKEDNEFGKFFGFDTLTLCPIDTRLIDKSLLMDTERQWLNDYHSRVRETLKSLLREELAEFLDEITPDI